MNGGFWRKQTLQSQIANDQNWVGSGSFAETERSTAEDLDMVQAISDFQNRQTGYDAALKAYSLVQRMSLFNYIGG